MNIFLLELRNIRKSAMISTLAISAVIFAMLALSPAMQTESMQALAGAKMEGLDPALLAMFGLTELMDFTLISNFFGFVLKFITLAIMFIVTQQAASLLIKEESDGTIEYLCAKPVSRTDIFSQKLLAHASVFVGMTAVYMVITTAGYLMFSDYTLAEAVREAAILFGGILFAGAVFSALGVMFSAVIKSSKSASGITIAIVFGTYVPGMLASVKKELDFLVWFSPIDWIEPQKLLRDGLLVQEWIIGFAVIIAGALAGWLRYRKKDLLI